ncbi:hypothetical protein NW754_016377 [Fusarium falciforme]|uniref:Uncharacterized protein n=1 Tax=Fusarium falciforme TaxID=195108 RepID=A0A9W8R1Z3_9HYPO|nr:hypothetical protein NW754_016377 [Fusarium falciforme]KAJ4184600.1 hypothetical protein NW755_009054 [Fusarium falciforme]KAJ4199629.1 hypothetical protein NW767_008051 [Fusarium falciforme]KAJ4246699.1 hypothetical protein NW757_009287 [Fusarium falciforme]
MNPCAPAFVPSSQSSESDPDSAKKPTRSPAKKPRPGRDAPSLKPKPKHKRNKSSVSVALDPKKYDTMFPSLPKASPPKEQPVQKAKASRKKKKRAKRVSVHSPENGDPSKPSGAAAEGQTAPEPTVQEETVQEAPEKPELEPKPELLQPTVYTPAKPKLELLKPTVYTPPTSSHTSRRDQRVDNLQSPRARVNKPVGRSSRPRPRPDVPPTPHHDPRNRGRKQPVAGPPVTRVGTPAAVHALAPFNPNAPLGPMMAPMMGPFDPQGMPFPPMCGPSPMPFPLVPWNMMPVPWHPYQPQMPFAVEGYDGQFWPQPPPVAAQAPQLQGPPRPGSCESSKHSDSLSTPRTTAFRARGGHQASNSLSTVPGPGTDIIPRTQVEMFKNQERAKSSSPRGPRFGPKGKAAWVKASPLGKTCAISVAPNDKEIPMTTAAKTFDKHLREVTDPRKCAGFIPTRQVQTSLGSPRVMNVPSASGHNDSLLRNHKMPRVQLPQQTDSSVAGPSSQRRTLKPVNSNTQSSSALTGPEAGTWSQSKRWTSTAAKERQSFQKMMANLRYMGADQSPFVPQTPAELTAFKVAIAETEKLKLAEEVSRRVAQANAKIEGVEAKQLLKELMGGKIFSDHLSPVFAMNNCFNKKLPSNLVMQAEWPPLSEFKEEGDKRAGRPGRCLPLPRLNLVAPRYIHRPWEAYNPDGTIRWDKKVVQVGSHFICAVTQPDASITPPVELKIDALHFLLRAILGEIDGVEPKTDKEEIEEKEEVSAEQDNREEEES